MSRFYIIFKQYIQYYLYLLIVLGILYLIIPRPFILGLMIGTCGSLVNTYIFESYLAKAQQQDAIHISTGNIWISCSNHCVFVMVFFKDHINIIGVLIGLMISYIVIILRPLLKRE